MVGGMYSSRITTLRDLHEQDALVEAILESNRIGMLNRSGRTIYYANLYPLHLGQTVEGKTRYEVAVKVARATAAAEQLLTRLVQCRA